MKRKLGRPVADLSAFANPKAKRVAFPAVSAAGGQIDLALFANPKAVLRESHAEAVKLKNHAKVSEGVILCKVCRHSKGTAMRQCSLSSFLEPRSEEEAQGDGLSPNDDNSGPETDGEEQKPDQEPEEKTYQHFAAEERQRLRTERPDLVPADLERAIGEAWRERSAGRNARLEIPLCSQCRKPLREKSRALGPRTYKSCPFLMRLASYKRVAHDKDVAFDMTDAAAIARMREPCSMCGAAAPLEGNGLTRMGKRDEGKRSMGPFSLDNTAPCCSRCNLMKGAHFPPGFIEICKTIATHNGRGEFGLFPARFRNNTRCHLRRPPPVFSCPTNQRLLRDLTQTQVEQDFFYGSTLGLYSPHAQSNDVSYSLLDGTVPEIADTAQSHRRSLVDGVTCIFGSKRSRSSYLTNSKTHAMSNELFTEITRQPCFFCGKKADPPNHYNGLDRLDSTVRLYTAETAVSCCGTCNVCKYRFTVDEFLTGCQNVAEFNN